MKRIYFFAFSLVFSLSFLVSCAAPKSDSPADQITPNFTVDANTATQIGSKTLTWYNMNLKQSGYLASYFLSPKLTFDYGGGLYCFENNSACQRAAQPVREGVTSTDLTYPGVGNAPVFIQGFQAALKKIPGHTYTLNAVSVTTGQLVLNFSTGEFTFTNKISKNIVGSGCDLSNANSVGFDASQEGEEQGLTGLYLFNNATESPGVGYRDAYLDGSVKVFHSGVIPVDTTVSDPKPFRYKFTPFDTAASIDFGSDSSFLEDSSHLMIPPTHDARIGLSSADAATTPSWADHVILGYCINGTHSYSVTPTGGKAKTVTFPLFMGGAIARLYNVKMQNTSATTTTTSTTTTTVPNIVNSN